MFSKKFLSGLMAAAMMVSMGASSAFAENAVPGDLATADTTLQNSVMRLMAFGVMEGYNGQFNPNDNLTRAQAAKIFVNATGNGRLKGTANKFADVKSTDWFLPYVNVADQVGLMLGGNKDGKRVFNPNQELNYAQIATIAVRALGYKDADLDGSTWPYNYMAKAMELGVFDNVNGDVDADAKVTRGDMAAVVDQMLQTPTKAQAAVANNKNVLLDRVAGKFVKMADNKATVVNVKSLKDVTVAATSLTDSTLAANQVKFLDADSTTDDTVVYTIPAEDLRAKLIVGSKAGKVYYDDKTKSVISANDMATASVFTNTASADVAATTAIKYKDASAVEQSIVLDGSTKYYYNGALAPNASLTKIKSGDAFTAIGKDRKTADDKMIYDYVFVNRVNEPVIVSADVTSDDAKVVNNIGAINLIKNDGSGNAAKVTVTGAATKLSEIKKNDVIYETATDDNAVIKLEVVRGNATTGKVLSRTLNTDGTTLATVTLNDNKGAYTCVAGISANALALNTSYTLVLGKDNKIVGIANAVATPYDAGQTVAGVTYNYGYVTEVKAADIFNAARVTIVDTTGATKTVTLADVQPAAVVAGDLYRYTVDATTGKATMYIMNTTKAIDLKNVTANTKVYVRNQNDATQVMLSDRKYAIAGETAEVVVASDIDSIGTTGKNPFGDYYIVVLNRATAPVDNSAAFAIPTTVAGTTYGFVVSSAGDAMYKKADGTEIEINQFNVIVNGTASVIKVAKKDANGNANVMPVVGDAITNVVTGTDGLTTFANVSPVAVTSFKAIDATRIKCTINGLEQIISLDPAVKIYNSAKKALEADATNVNATTIQKLIINGAAGNGNVMGIIISKE